MSKDIQSYPRRIICLTEETTETLYLLGEQDRIVGVSGYTVRPPEARQSLRSQLSSTRSSIRFWRWNPILFSPSPIYKLILLLS